MPYIFSQTIINIWFFQRSAEGGSRELNEATSEFVTGDHRASSALSPYPDASRRESNVAISSTYSNSLGSSSEEDESVDAFNRRGHQGSYVLRKASLHLTHSLLFENTGCQFCLHSHKYVARQL